MPARSNALAKLWLKVRFGVILALILSACIGGITFISLNFLMQNSLRLDEAQSIWQTSHSFGGMLKIVAEDVHMPLYHVLLHFWQTYMGQEVTTIRLMSLGLFLASVPLFYVLSRQVLSRGWSIFAVIIFSFSPFMNWYGSEARMYTLLAFMSILSQLFFTRIIKYNKGWVGYALSAIIGAFSHYFFFFNLLTQALFYLANRKKFAPGSFKKFIATAIAVMIAVAPWIYYFYSQGSGGNTSPLLVTPSSVDFFNAFSQFAFGFQTNAVNTILVSCWPLLILIGFFAIRRSQRIPIEIQYIAAAALVPVIAAFIVSLTITPFFVSRYMVSVIAPLTILMVWFISHYPRKLAIAAGGLIVVAMAIGFCFQVTDPATPVKENYKQAAQIISREASPQDIVVLSAPFTVYPFQYYYEGEAQISTLPVWDRSVTGPVPAFDAKKLPDQVAQLNRNHRYVYLLLSQDQGYEKQIQGYYEERFERIDHQNLSDGMNLYIYKVGYKEVPSL